MVSEFYSENEEVTKSYMKSPILIFDYPDLEHLQQRSKQILSEVTEDDELYKVAKMLHSYYMLQSPNKLIVDNKE